MKFSTSLRFSNQPFQRSVVLSFLMLLSMLFGLQSSFAQTFPAKPVTIIVPFTLAGGADTLARILVPRLNALWGQNVIVEYKAGASGQIGADFVSKANPDGYTLLMATTAVINDKNVSKFTGISLVSADAYVLVVHPSLPINNASDLIAYAKANPVSWGSPGKGTHGYLIGEAFEVMSSTPMQHVAYKGGSPAVADTIAGHIPALFTTLSTASAQIQAGKLRALAITSSKRMPEFPNVPTFAEQGYPKLIALTWFSLSGPPGMPPALVEKLNKETRKIMQSQVAKDTLAKQSMETFDWDSARFTQYVGEELKQWAPMIKTVKPEN